MMLDKIMQNCRVAGVSGAGGAVVDAIAAMAQPWLDARMREVSGTESGMTNEMVMAGAVPAAGLMAAVDDIASNVAGRHAAE